jgi:hypothetical protein
VVFGIYSAWSNLMVRDRIRDTHTYDDPDLQQQPWDENIAIHQKKNPKSRTKENTAVTDLSQATAVYK